MWHLWQQQQNMFQAPAVDIQLPRLLRRVKKDLPVESFNGLPSSKDAQRAVASANKAAEAAAMRAARLAAAVGHPHNAPAGISLDLSEIAMEDAGAVEGRAKLAEASQADRHKQLQEAVAKARQRKEAEAKQAAAIERARAELEARQEQEEQERARVEVARKREQQRAAAAASAAEAAQRQEQRRQQDKAPPHSEPVASPSGRPRRAAAVQAQRRRASSSDEEDAAISDSDAEVPHGHALSASHGARPGKPPRRGPHVHPDPASSHDGSHGVAAGDSPVEDDSRAAPTSRANKSGESARPRRGSPHGRAPTYDSRQHGESPLDDDTGPLTTLMAGVTKRKRTNTVPAGHEARAHANGQQERSYNAAGVSAEKARPTRQASAQKQQAGMPIPAKGPSNPQDPGGARQAGAKGPKRALSPGDGEMLKGAKPAAGRAMAGPLLKGKAAAGSGPKVPLQRVMLRKKDLSMNLVDRHLQVFWPDDETWWPGKVTALNLKKCEMTLFYETGEEEANMDLAALIRDGQVAWLHTADVPPDMRQSQPSKPSTTSKGPSNSKPAAVAAAPAGQKPAKKRQRLETPDELDEAEPAKPPKKQRGVVEPQSTKPSKQGSAGQASKAPASMAHRQSLQEAIAAASRLPTGPRPPSQQSKRSPANQQQLPQQQPTQSQRKGARQQAARQKKAAEEDAEEQEGGLAEILALGKAAEGRSVRIKWPAFGQEYSVTIVSCSQKQRSAVVAYGNGRKETLHAADEPSKYIVKLLAAAEHE